MWTEDTLNALIFANIVSNDREQIDAAELRDTLVGMSGAIFQQLKGVQSYQIETFGGTTADVTGAINVAAWNAAVAAIGSNSGIVQFGPGTYLFNSGLNYSVPPGASFMVCGVGKGVTNLRWDVNANALNISQNSPYGSVHVQDLSIITAIQNAGAAILLTNAVALGFLPASSINNVTIAGIPASSSNYWTDGIVTRNLSFVNLDQVDIYGSDTSQGNGFSFSGTAATSSNAIIANVSKCNFVYNNIGVFFGDWAQGLTITQTNFVNGIAGIVTSTNTGGGTADQLSVATCQFNVSQQAINALGIAGEISVTGTLIYCSTSPNQPAISIGSTASQFSISANQFVGAGSPAWAISVAGGYGTINANIFNNLEYGVNLGASANHINTQGNVFTAVTTPITDAGTNNISANNIGDGFNEIYTTPTTAVALDFSPNNAISINNGSNAAVPFAQGLLVIDEITETGSAVLWLLASSGPIVISQSGTLWAASTTTPSAGYCSVAYNGSTWAIYNNQGHTCTFKVAQLKVA